MQPTRQCGLTKKYDDHNILTIMPKTTKRKELSHDRILDVAARAIRRSGYGGAGLATIMQEAGLTHGGFYAHFPSRESLLAEATVRAGRDTGKLLIDCVNQARDKGENPFAGLVLTYLADAQLSNVECGCVVAALVSEIPRQTEEVASAARDRVKGLVELVRRTLPDGTDVVHAQMIAATLVGTMQIARTMENEDGKKLLAYVRKRLIQQYGT